MKLIRKEANPSGAYSGLVICDLTEIPDDCYEWPEDVDDTLFYQKRGFVILTTNNNKVVSYEANEIKYEEYMQEHEEAEKKAAYEARTVELIRQQYSENDEYKVLREYLAQTNIEAFATYNAYVEQCKQQAHDEIYGGEESYEFSSLHV